jgi:hypothetical protein
MTRKEYRTMDWQSKDQAFYDWLDQYLEDNAISSFEEMGDYGHVDIVELRKEFVQSLA